MLFVSASISLPSNVKPFNLTSNYTRLRQNMNNVDFKCSRKWVIRCDAHTILHVIVNQRDPWPNRMHRRNLVFAIYFLQFFFSFYYFVSKFAFCIMISFAAVAILISHSSLLLHVYPSAQLNTVYFQAAKKEMMQHVATPQLHTVATVVFTLTLRLLFFGVPLIMPKNIFVID